MVSFRILSAPDDPYEYLVKSLAVGIIYSLCILAFLYGTLFFKVAPIMFNAFTSLFLGVLSGVIISFVLGYVSTKLSFSVLPRFMIIFAILFIVGYFSNIVEYLFFSTATFSDISYEMLYMFVTHIIVSITIVFLFPPYKVTSSLTEQLKLFFSKHSTGWWIIRISIAGVLYLPVYLFFGALFSPIIVPFYTDPSFGLNLTIPPFEVIVPLEIARGFVYVILLVPILASVNLERHKQIILLAAILFCVGVLPGLISNQTWPLLLRLAHGLEIAADSFVYGYVIVKIISS